MKRHKSYSEDLIRRVVAAYRNRGDRDAVAIQKQFGVGRTALFRWVREADALDRGRKKRAKKGARNRPTEFGTIIRQAREQKGLSQLDLGKVLEKQAKSSAGNHRLSTFELGKTIPSDAELAVIAQQLGLSVASLRTKRDEANKILEARRRASRKRGIEKRRENKIAQGSSILAPKPAQHAHAAKRVSRPEPAEAPTMADFIELIDGIAPMPTDKETRKRWFNATMELFKIGGTG